jgi:2-polyprenyl-6-methoxyphenol hydroxylase-like FAD-dependent oxidoreductase
MNDTPATTTDVLIVGAGPVGLALAADLHRHGVLFRLVDRKGGPERYSKAANFWPRTQEVAHAIGFGPEVHRIAVAVRATTVHAFGQLLGTVPTRSRPTTPFPETLAVNQGKVEGIVSAHLEAHGHRVEYGTAFVSLAQDDAGVTVELEDANGRREIVRARYVVGTDGGKSRVREAAGIRLTPVRLEGKGLQQVDARLRWSRPVTHDHIWFYLFDSGFCGIVPLPDKLYRFFLCRDLERVPDRAPTLEEMNLALREITGDPSAEFYDPAWFSHGLFAYGVAETYRARRVLLAGDAGHNTIPIGGQGMNAAIQDAFNLGWKLAAVLRDGSSEALLDTYAVERRAVRAELAQDQKDNFNRLMRPTALTKFVQRSFGAFVLRRTQSVELGRRDEAQLSVNYPRSPLSVDRLRRGRVRAGDRAPDAPVVRASDLTTTTLFADVYAGGWTLVLFDGGRAAACSELEALALEVRASLPAVRTLRVLAAESASRTMAHDVRLDLDRLAHARFDVRQPCVYLVRPDGYIGYRGGAADLGGLLKYAGLVLRLGVAQPGVRSSLRT